MRAVQIHRFIKEPTSVDWLVDGLLPNIGWTLFVGMKGLGKSTFSIQLCDAIQQGVEFLGRSTKQTQILYIQADSQGEEWKAMLERIVPHSHGWTMVDVPSNCMNNPTYVGSISRLIDKVQPGFIVFDSLYNLTNTSLNSDGILAIIDTMKGLADTVPWLLIHHPPHGETRAAGHHSLGGNCSNEWHLLKTKLKIDKCRLSGLKEVALRKDTNGLWELRESVTDSFPELQGRVV